MFARNDEVIPTQQCHKKHFLFHLTIVDQTAKRHCSITIDIFQSFCHCEEKLQVLTKQSSQKL
ncbi:MAG: hypothetical protein ACEY3D_01920 [Rickettsia sp.]|uniref:hypothetical protein n=1 Tax=Rickettsia sp. TaxID=789 RepID=UPI00397B792A